MKFDVDNNIKTIAFKQNNYLKTIFGWFGIVKQRLIKIAISPEITNSFISFNDQGDNDNVI